MRKHKNKYLNINKTPKSISFQPEVSLILRFKEPTGRWQIIDLTFFEKNKFPRNRLGKEIAYSFQKLTSDLATGTRKQLRNVLKHFNEFLDWKAGSPEFKNIDSLSELDFNLLVEYQAYLELVTKQKNAENSYGYFSRFIHKISIRIPGLLSKEIQIPANKFVSNRKTTRLGGNIISLENLKAIHDAALKEYEQIRTNHKKALKLLKITENLPIVEISKRSDSKSKKAIFRPWKKDGYFLHHLVRETGILNPVPGSTINAIRENKSTKATNQLGWYIPNSDKNLLPILILLYIKTGINVTSMHYLKRDCLIDHPLPLNLTILRFSKPRSGSGINKELSFPSKQKNGVVDLITFLLDYTNPLVEFASPDEKKYLFLYKHNSQVKSAHFKGFCSNGLKPFISRNNLPDFNLNQIRPTVASLLYLQTKDIFRVQRLLNHSDVRSTINYIRGPVVQLLHNKQISDGIETLFDKITGNNSSTSDITVFTNSSSEVIPEKIVRNEITREAGKNILEGGCNTIIGKCKDPYNSPQPGEIQGRVCKSLHSCIFCKNCWIFLENLPDVIRYRNKLLADKVNMTDQQWSELHEETVRTIENSILSSFPKKIIKDAEKMIENS